MLGAARPSAAPEFDVSASLGALDELEPPPESVAVESAPRAVQNVDVDQVFAKFKAGVRAQVTNADSATHYDLGVAYKEMGMVGDAINEFEAAARDPSRECMCFAMIGMIHLEQGALDKAAESYIKGLSATDKTVEQEMSLYYDLGNVYEMKGKNQDALYYFQKIARRDPGYRDIADRIQTLAPQLEIAAPKAPAARAVNDDEEFDRVFDDLFDK
jgi:tetratricopeptide (TPR) repeat protein